MQLSPRNQRLRSKPSRRERRKIRRSPMYIEIRSRLGTNDPQTLLLLQVGDAHLAHAGQQVTQRSWSRSHVLVGLAPRLAVAGSDAGEISAPWVVLDDGLDVNLTIASPGSVLFIHRRHLPLVESILAGATEPVSRLTRAALHRPSSARHRLPSESSRSRPRSTYEALPA